MAKAKAKQVNALSDLTPDPRNARRHTERNVGMIRDALAEVGAARSIVIDERGVILAGNATAKAASNAGLKLQVVDADGDTVVAVRRSGLTAKQKTRLALFDNRAAEEAEWDTSVLGEFQTDGLLDGMWSAEELEALLAVPEGGEPEETEIGGLTFCERFLVPPFSVLDARQGYWQARKRQWLALGIQSELGRGGHLAGVRDRRPG